MLTTYEANVMRMVEDELIQGIPEGYINYNVWKHCITTCIMLLKAAWNFIFTLICVGFLFSCKKAINDTVEEKPNPTYLYQEFNPFLYTGWVGQTSYEVDSTFYLALNVNQDGSADMTFYIHEWLKSFLYAQDSTRYLPMQRVWVKSVDKDYCQLS